MTNTTNLIFWTALTLFFLAVLVELYMRTDKIRKDNHKKPHATRIDKALAHFRKVEAEKITNDDWQKVTKVSDATAARDLKHLVEFGVLEQRGRGRGVHYVFINQPPINN